MQLSFRALATMVASLAVGAAVTPADAQQANLCAQFAGKRYLTEAELSNKDGNYVAAGIIDFKANVVHGFWTHRQPNPKAEGGTYTFTCSNAKDKSGVAVAAVVTSNSGQILLYPAPGGRGLPKIVNGNGLFAYVPTRVFELR